MATAIDNTALVDGALVDDSHEAFETFVKTHMKPAYRMALGLVGNHDDALELSQEAFARAYQYRRRLKSRKKFFPWFYQILRNLCFSHLRKKRYRHAASLNADDSQAGVPVPADDRFDPEALAERHESHTALWAAIGRLEAHHREVIMLRHFQNLSYHEMAKLLLCSEATVTSRLYNARQKLKGLLEGRKGGPR